jgi:hypothetical protein
MGQRKSDDGRIFKLEDDKRMRSGRDSRGGGDGLVTSSASSSTRGEATAVDGISEKLRGEGVVMPAVAMV